MRSLLLLTALAISTGTSAAPQDRERDAHIVRCIALLDIVHEMQVNDPLVEYRAHSILLQGLSSQDALVRLPDERAWLLENPESWTSGQDPFGCFALIQRLADEQS